MITKIFGPPGTGKTTTMLNMVEEALKSHSPERIAYLSFTKAACSTAINRAVKKFNLKVAQLPWFRTLHSICYRLLEINQGRMAADHKALSQLSELTGLKFTSKSQQLASKRGDLVDFGGKELGDQLLALNHFSRQLMMSSVNGLELWPGDKILPREAAWFDKTYRQWKEKEIRVDFTDLLEMAWRGDAKLDVDVVFVDEAQDLTPLQWRTLKTIWPEHADKYIAGDDDQAIFTWAGADPAELINLSADEVKVLDQSWRLPKKIFDLSQRVVADVKIRQEKKFRPMDREGSLTRVSEVKDLTRIPLEGSVLVLYRSHYQSREIEDWLRKQGEPYLRSHRPAPGLEHAPAIVAYEWLRKGKVITVQQAIRVLQATVNGGKFVPHWRRQHDEKNVGWTDLEHTGLYTEKLPWYEALTKIEQRPKTYLRRIISRYGAKGLRDTPRVKLSTIHGVKGDEADHVLLLTEMSPMVQKSFNSNGDAERRVYYVGVTRARESLTLIGRGNPML